jgi:uncharacterized membrane protein YcaP (DUF421 family)
LVKVLLTVIMDGELLEETIYGAGFSIDWIKSKLSQKEATVEEVFLGQVDVDGNLYVDLYHDDLNKNSEGENGSN